MDSHSLKMSSYSLRERSLGFIKCFNSDMATTPQLKVEIFYYTAKALNLKVHFEHRI